ncbi:MAG: NAD(P)-dependent oxidoreductase [Chloroflexi bacterium]|nr:NAD(P)-dependent oxidoreductase [Chloroflexota bacterium]
MSETIGFIGLGIMGRPMAKNLLRVGHRLVVWNRSRPGIEELAREGAQEGSGPANVAHRCDIVITMLPDSPDVEQVAVGPGGVTEGAHRGPVHIDMSTISPEVTRRVAERLAQAGVEMLDAPVSGGEPGAIAGTLSIMAGGRRETFERCLPVLEALGKKIVYCGGHGSGQTVKLCNQIVVALNNLAICEALAFCLKAGIQPEAVGAGAGSSWAVLNLAPKVLDGDFRPGFKVAHQLKDLRLALETAEGLGASLAGTSLVHRLFAGLEEEGLGGEGTQALFKAVRKTAAL